MGDEGEEGKYCTRLLEGARGAYVSVWVLPLRHLARHPVVVLPPTMVSEGGERYKGQQDLMRIVRQIAWVEVVQAWG